MSAGEGGRWVGSVSAGEGGRWAGSVSAGEREGRLDRSQPERERGSLAGCAGDTDGISPVDEGALASRVIAYKKHGNLLTGGEERKSEVSSYLH